MKRLLTVLALALAASGAQAATTTFRSTMSGPAEGTPNASPGYGVATIVLDDTANTLSLDIPFTDLLAGTTAAHIHCCTADPLTGTAAVATTLPAFADFPLGVTSGHYTHTLDLLDPVSYNPSFITAHGGTVDTAEAALIAGMLANESYLNLHTSLYPGGEIRGFLVELQSPVPEPGMAWMMWSGLAAVGVAGWLRGRRG
ncbi:CHRD domain-containing protein [Massilia arenosa]|uniref:CHRD domain-containing protein n=1 Tax=Zemynaea arenosa TaxID=2561931 RepID=A0A4Y9SEV1_9BURK|nr:CHRD domain-containing protein [Massilia arenosa]TFW19322.1 CHRD domain-containing protein [Massilia arenosa]